MTIQHPPVTYRSRWYDGPLTIALIPAAAMLMVAWAVVAVVDLAIRKLTKN